MQAEKQEFQQRLQKIEGLVRTIEAAADPLVRTSAVELMQALLELHGAGLERMLEIVFARGAAGEEILDRLAHDDLAASLLLLHGLHPLELETRVTQALDKVRPYLSSHGGNVELIGIAEGVVRLRLAGTCNGCASSAMTLKLAIEEAIYEFAPDLTALEVEGVKQPSTSSGFVQLQPTPHRNGAANGADKSGWETVHGLTALAQGTVQTIEVAGRQVLFCRVEETFYAYDDSCPACQQTMRPASLKATALVCPACGQRFDVLRAGRGLEQPSLYLEPFPLLIAQGEARIALPALAK
jgi:Fe-S cluster biogenesis protein NfuA/nitrite reductase/ring-hydroxylating ferredoxin subunit